MTHDDWLFTQGFLLGLIVSHQLTSSWFYSRYVMYRRKRTAEGKEVKHE